MATTFLFSSLSLLFLAQSLFRDHSPGVRSHIGLSLEDKLAVLHNSD